jgi:hypothetical protein
LSSSCVLCTQMWPVSLDCLRLVSCVLKCGQCLWIVFVLCLVYSNVASVSGLSLSCVLCTQMWPVSLDCLFMMPFLVFTNVYLYSICVVMLLVSFQTLFCCIVYISDMYTDKVIIINTKDHITQTLVTLDHIPQTLVTLDHIPQTLVTLNDFRLSCLAHLSLLFPIILPLFGYPIFWPSVNLMKVIPETCRVH